MRVNRNVFVYFWSYTLHHSTNSWKEHKYLDCGRNFIWTFTILTLLTIERVLVEPKDISINLDFYFHFALHPSVLQVSQDKILMWLAVSEFIQSFLPALSASIAQDLATTVLSFTKKKFFLIIAIIWKKKKKNGKNIYPIEPFSCKRYDIY